MAESTGGNSQTETSPSTGPSSFGSAIVSQGLATVHEVPYHNARYNENASLDKRIHSARRASTNSLDASLRSSSGPKCGKKKGEASPQRPRNTKLANAGHETWRRSEIPSRTITNSNHRDTGLDRGSESASPKKEKLGGFRSTLRRMFGRRSNRDRKSMPTPTFYPRHVSFIVRSHPVSRVLTHKKGSRGIHYLCDRCQDKTLCFCTNQWPSAY